MAIQGSRELKATLRAIRSGNNNASRNAAYAGARLLRDAERRAAPRASGHGVKTIFAKRERGKPGEAVSIVGVAREGFYLKILEKGAKPHVITVNTVHRRRDQKTRKILGKEKGRRALAIGLGFGRGHGLIVFRRSVQHPGVRATRWFSRTYEQQKASILERIKAVYAENLQKQAEKKGL